jgi:hypothetical protein
MKERLVLAMALASSENRRGIGGGNSEAAMSQTNTQDESIYVLDELQLKPGQLAAFLEAMETHYRPGAEARGQQLIHTWVTPPTHTPGITQNVLLVWRLSGVEGFWTMRSQNASPEVAEWWAESVDYIESRTRRFAAAPSAIPGFEALGRLNA